MKVWSLLLLAAIVLFYGAPAKAEVYDNPNTQVQSQDKSRRDASGTSARKPRAAKTAKTKKKPQ
jgi:hypothetical protein